MPRLTDFRINPPKNDDLFEDMCCELWRRIWGNPYAKRHGRSGQKQQGVDIYGIPQEQNQFDGIQCKAVAEPLTESDIRGEVAAAEKFTPSLKRLIIATTAPRDAKGESFARAITIEHLQQNLFSVELLGWKDILGFLYNYPELIAKYLTVEQQSVIVAESVIERFQPSLLQISKQIEEVGNTLANEGTDTVLGEILDSIRNTLNEFRYRDALQRLDEFDRIYSSRTGERNRFRALYYRGEALFHINQQTQAAVCYLQAYALAPNEEVATSRAAVAYLIYGDFQKSEQYALDALTKNPTDGFAASVLLNSRIRNPNHGRFLDDEYVGEILASLPIPVRDSPEVYTNLAAICGEQNNIPLAERLIRHAVARDVNKHPELYSLLGMILLKRAEQLPTMSAAVALILEAEDALNTAWDKVKHADTGEDFADCLLNFGIAHRLLGKIDEGRACAEEALRRAPDYPVVYLNLALINIVDQPDTAVNLLRQGLNRTPAEKFPFIMLLATALQSLGDLDSVDEASNLLAEAETEATTEAQAIEVTVARIRFTLQRQRTDDVQQLVREAVRRFPANVGVYAVAAEVTRITGSIQDGEEVLSNASLIDRAWNLLTEKTEREELASLAFECHQAKLPAQESELLARLAVPGEDYLINRSLTIALYESGNREKALQVALPILEKTPSAMPYADIVTAIYEEIGDLPSARRIAESAIMSNPKNLQMQLRHTYLCLHLGDDVSADRLFDVFFDVSEFTVDNARHYSKILAYRDRRVEALQFAYNIRERYSYVADAHFDYVMLFLGVTQEQDHLPILDVTNGVAPETVVSVIDETGDEHQYWIETKPVRPDIYHRPIDDPLAQRFLGKSIGEIIIISHNSIAPISATIKEVKSKYVQAFQDSMNNYQQWFPEASGLWRVQIPILSDTASQEEREAALRPIFNVIDHHDERRQKAEDFFRQNTLPMCFFSVITGNSILASMAYFANTEQGIQCCAGDTKSYEEAQRLVDSTHQLVADASALVTIFYLLEPCRSALLQNFGPFFTPQSVRDLFHDMAQKATAERGERMKMMREGDHYVRYEITEDEATQWASHLSEMTDWVNKHTEVKPITILLQPDTAKEFSLRKTLTSPYTDPLLLAKELNLPLLSDDLYLRVLAENEYQIGGVWAQVLMLNNRVSDIISSDDLEDSTLSLIQRNYRHIKIRSETIVRAAERAEWQPVGDFIVATRQLHGDKTDNSAVLVALQAMYGMARRLGGITPNILLTNLNDALLTAVMTMRDRQQTLRLLRASIPGLSRIYSPMKIEVVNAINAWFATHPIR